MFVPYLALLRRRPAPPIGLTYTVYDGSEAGRDGAAGRPTLAADQSVTFTPALQAGEGPHLHGEGRLRTSRTVTRADAPRRPRRVTADRPVRSATESPAGADASGAQQAERRRRPPRPRRRRRGGERASRCRRHEAAVPSSRKFTSERGGDEAAEVGDRRMTSSRAPSRIRASCSIDQLRELAPRAAAAHR